MRFDLPESIEAMRAGRKTQTRRRDERGFWLAKRPGSTITIVHQGRYLGQATVCRTWRERHVYYADWLAEGYETWPDFWQTWQRLYPESNDLDEVTVIEFKDVRWRDG